MATQLNLITIKNFINQKQYDKRFSLAELHKMEAKSMPHYLIWSTVINQFFCMKMFLDKNSSLSDQDN